MFKLMVVKVFSNSFRILIFHLLNLDLWLGVYNGVSCHCLMHNGKLQVYNANECNYYNSKLFKF